MWSMEEVRCVVEVIVTNVVVGDENIEIDQHLNLFELGLDSLGSVETSRLG